MLVMYSVILCHILLWIIRGLRSPGIEFSALLSKLKVLCLLFPKVLCESMVEIILDFFLTLLSPDPITQN